MTLFPYQFSYDHSLIYFGWDFKARPDGIPGSVGDEVIGVAFGKLYLGWYTNAPKLSLMWGDKAIIGPA